MPAERDPSSCPAGGVPADPSLTALTHVPPCPPDDADLVELKQELENLKVNEIHIFRDVQAKVMEAEKKEQLTWEAGRMGISEDFTEEMVL